MRLPFNGSYPITQRFGVNPAAYAQFGMKGHNGIDYALPTGTPVVAAISGTVQVLSDPPGFGNYVTVTNGQYKTIYAHLQRATVNSGQQVTAGQQIGISDNTGNSTGPHLHFGVKPINVDNNNGFFGAIDPQPILNQGESDMATKEQLIELYKLSFPNQDVNYEWVKAYTGRDMSDVIQILRDDPSRQRYISALVNDAAAYNIGSKPSDLGPGLYRVK
jgi:hypothetical protein